MFSDYLNKLRASGRLYFTTDQAMIDLKATRQMINAATYRMKKNDSLISPARGLYIIVPPEHKPQGSIPAEEVIPILTKYLGVDYYVCLLTAAIYYGATHQKPGSFQIITSKQIKHPLTFGQLHIECVYKRSIANLPTRDIIVRTGYLKISSAELTAMDLFLYPNRSGGINHIATVLSELVESIDSGKLLTLAKKSGKKAWVQRLGYMLEKIEVLNNDVKQTIINKLADYVASTKPNFIPLAPELPTAGSPRSKKWMIIENTTIEGDE